MEKQKITNTRLKEMASFWGTKLYRCGYADLQHLFSVARKYPKFYNSGVYGWNYDVYYLCTISDTYFIVTGYRGYSNKIKTIPTKTIEKYEKKAYILSRKAYKNQNLRVKAGEKLLEQFLSELK